MKEHFRHWLRDEMPCTGTLRPMGHWVCGKEFVLFQWKVSLFQESQTSSLYWWIPQKHSDTWFEACFHSATMWPIWGGINPVTLALKCANWLLGKTMVPAAICGPWSLTIAHILSVVVCVIVLSPLLVSSTSRKRSCSQWAFYLVK